MLEVGDRKDRLFIADDRFTDAFDGHGDTVVGGAFALDDLIGAVLDPFGDQLLLLFIVLEVFEHAVVDQRETGDLRAAPGDDLAVAVLADDIGVAVAGVDADIVADHGLEAGGVEDRAGPEDTVFGEAAHLDGGVGQDIDRVRDDDEHSADVSLFEFRHDEPEDPDVLFDEVQPGLPRSLGRARGHDDDRRVGNVIVGAGVDVHGTGKRQAVGDVHRLSFGFCLVCVDEDHFREQSALHQCETGGGADESASDHGNFSGVDFTHGEPFFLW